MRSGLEGCCGAAARQATLRRRATTTPRCGVGVSSLTPFSLPDVALVHRRDVRRWMADGSSPTPTSPFRGPAWCRAEVLTQTSLRARGSHSYVDPSWICRGLASSRARERRPPECCAVDFQAPSGARSTTLGFQEPNAPGCRQRRARARIRFPCGRRPLRSGDCRRSWWIRSTGYQSMFDRSPFRLRGSWRLAASSIGSST